MSLNFGSSAVEAMRGLRANADWKQIREAVLDQARKNANIALESMHGNPADACGYARALRDMYIAFESATMGVPVAQVTKPGTQETSDAT